jgi:hypothetical protein
LPVRGRRRSRLFHDHIDRRRVVEAGVATVRVLFIFLWFEQYIAFCVHLFPFCRSRSGRGSGDVTLGEGRRLGQLLFHGHGGRSLRCLRLRGCLGRPFTATEEGLKKSPSGSILFS